jgi:hypothetical protein
MLNEPPATYADPDRSIITGEGREGIIFLIINK